MSFDWNDHPVVSPSGQAAATPAPAGGFNWNDHPVVGAPSAQPAPMAATPQYKDLQDIAQNNPNSLAYQGAPTALDSAMEPVKRVMSIPAGITRTAAMGSLETLLPGENKVTGQDYIDALSGQAPGVGDQFERKYPGINQNVKDALNVGGNAALDPLMWSAVKGTMKPSPAAESLAPKTSEPPSGVAPWVAKKIGKVFASVPEETTARYLQDPDTINAAPERSQISDKLLELKKAAEDKVSQIHDALSEAKSTLADNKNDTRAGLQDQRFDLQGKLSDAQSAFNEKKQAFKEALKSNSLTSMAGDVHGAVGDLKDKLVQGSKDAYDILGKSKGSVSVDPIIKTLQNHIENSRVNGIAESPAADQAFNELRGWQDRLYKMTYNTDGKLTMPQAKQIMQGIDKSVDYSGPAGSFAPQTEAALKDVRSQIDQSVKGQVEPYRQKMLDVSRQAQLLDKTRELYGTPEKAISNLNGITSEKGQALHVPMLESLGKETGRDLSAPVKGYLLNDKILRTPSLFDQAIEEIPEAKALARAKAKLAEISDPAYSRNVSDAAHEPLLNKIKQYQADLESAKDRQALFSGVTSDSVAAKTKALGGANKYGAEIKFGDIDKAHGTDFEKQIRARNDLDQFQKTDTHGSRKTILGTLVGGALGQLIDHPIMGMEVGGMTGAAADKFSGQAFKSAVNTGVAVADKAKALSPVVKSGAKVLPFAAAGGSEANIISPAAVNAKKGPAKWANDGANKLIDHAPDDKATIEKGAASADPKVKQLLIQASDLKPGSRAMDAVMAKLKNKLAEGDE